MNTISVFFPKSGHFFQFSNYGNGDPPPKFSCAPVDQVQNNSRFY